MPVAQAPYWQETLRAQLRLLGAEANDNSRLWDEAAALGAGHGALAQLLGLTEAATLYRDLGAAAWVTSGLLRAAGARERRAIAPEPRKRLARFPNNLGSIWI